MTAPPPAPSGKWIKTWGAIAVAASTGDVGASVGKTSKAQAERDSVLQCQRSGANDCKAFSYHNQCAALAWPNQVNGSPSVGYGPDKSSAGSIAVKECISPDHEACKVVYSDCTAQLFQSY
ncbi:DUF4189 domain-containing protein [Xanthomonas tesorieronis]|uniref:DUF4189 domain-containing protein n=1 Tax=Xanthomonas tesorieronis TaxID=3160839 RepID=UPI00351857B7